MNQRDTSLSPQLLPSVVANLASTAPSDCTNVAEWPKKIFQNNREKKRDTKGGNVLSPEGEVQKFRSISIKPCWMGNSMGGKVTRSGCVVLANLCVVFFHVCFATPWGNAPLIRSKLSTTTLCTSGTYDHDLKQWDVRAVLFCGNIFYLQKFSTLVFRLLLRLQTSAFICCSPLILQALHKLIRNKLWHCSTTLHSICIFNQFHAGQLTISQPEQILKS